MASASAPSRSPRNALAAFGFLACISSACIGIGEDVPKLAKAKGERAGKRKGKQSRKGKKGKRSKVRRSSFGQLKLNGEGAPWRFVRESKVRADCLTHKTIGGFIRAYDDPEKYPRTTQCQLDQAGGGTWSCSVEVTISSPTRPEGQWKARLSYQVLDADGTVTFVGCVP